MFTGLVAVTGTVATLVFKEPRQNQEAESDAKSDAAKTDRPEGARIGFRAGFDDGPLLIGESIAVNGACLSVDALATDGFEVDATGETLARTTLGNLDVGSVVHLERSLKAGDRLGGHLVTGHIDGVGELLERRSAGDAVWMAFRAPGELSRFIAEKGSITVDGVSLTVNAAALDRFEVTLIPHTLGKTTLGGLKAGARVNLEVDLIARYVARFLSREP